MGYGYMALASKSEHENYLVGNPQFTYFKGVYKRHTNFSTSFKEILFSEEPDQSWGKKIFIKVPKDADLLHRVYLTFDLNMSGSNHIIGLDGGFPDFIYSIIEYIDIYIGDKLIDRHYAEWLYIWHDLFEKDSKKFLLGDMVSLNKGVEDGIYTYQIPLRFWFNNNVGLSLPLVALQYNEVKFEIKMSDRFFDYNRSQNKTLQVQIKKISLLLENYYLGNEERRMFTTNNHEYLITQVQRGLEKTMNSNTQKMINYDLNFRYPIKEIFWRIQNTTAFGATIEYENRLGKHHFNFWNNFNYKDGGQIERGIIKINNTIIADFREYFYKDIQNYQHHQSSGLVNITTGKATDPNDYTRGSCIYMYSFAITPKNHQPSGTLNFSKIENAQLRLTLQENASMGGNEQYTRRRRLRAYALNYNVLKINEGSGNLVFVN